MRQKKRKGKSNLFLPPVSWCLLLLLWPPAAPILPVVSVVLQKLNPVQLHQHAAIQRGNGKPKLEFA
jgi:hypothetical protein